MAGNPGFVFCEEIVFIHCVSDLTDHILRRQPIRGFDTNTSLYHDL